jgi:hypothetical protein
MTMSDLDVGDRSQLQALFDPGWPDSTQPRVWREVWSVSTNWQHGYEL